MLAGIAALAWYERMVALIAALAAAIELAYVARLGVAIIEWLCSEPSSMRGFESVLVLIALVPLAGFTAIALLKLWCVTRVARGSRPAYAGIAAGLVLSTLAVSRIGASGIAGAIAMTMLMTAAAAALAIWYGSRRRSV